MNSRSSPLGFAFAVAMVLALSAPQTAHAWKVENDGATSGAGPRFVDPDDQVRNFGRPGTGNSNGSGPQYFFGTQSSDQARNPWRNPATRPLNPDSLYPGSNRD